MMRPLSIALLVSLAACGGDDGGTDDGTWELLGAQRPSSLLAVWASSKDDVWVVGGREGAGGAPVAHHYDGAAWSRVESGLTNVDFWQVFGFEGGPIFIGGSNGTILRYQNGAFEKITTPGNDIIFGLWGSAPDDVWAVGGTINGRAFVWRYRGTAFEVVAGVPQSLVDMGTIWKVIGRSANEVYMSASNGTILKWDGAQLTSETIGANGESLFSIGCSQTRCVTAGTNTTNGVLYTNTGAGWTSRVPTTDGPVWRGVTPVGANPYIVGQFGAVLHANPDDTFTSDPHGLTNEDAPRSVVDARWSSVRGGRRLRSSDHHRGCAAAQGHLRSPCIAVNHTSIEHSRRET